MTKVAFFISKKTTMAYLEYDYKGRTPIPNVELLLFTLECSIKQAKKMKSIVFEAIKKDTL